MVKVLFVCTGNICRSPTAEGVFRHLVDEAGLSDRVEVDSCATQGWHIGNSPDIRSQQAAADRDIDISRQLSRRIVGEDFETFDYVIAVDKVNHDRLLLMSRDRKPEKIFLMMSFAPGLGYEEVPDPYYGGPNGFELVLDLIEKASAGLLAEIKEKLG